MSKIKERLDYRQKVVDRQLAHAPKDKVASTYDRAQFHAEQRRMMQDWADYIDAISGKGAPHLTPRLKLASGEFSQNRRPPCLSMYSASLMRSQSKLLRRTSCINYSIGLVCTSKYNPAAARSGA